MQTVGVRLPLSKHRQPRSNGVSRPYLHRHRASLAVAMRETSYSPISGPTGGRLRDRQGTDPGRDNRNVAIAIARRSPAAQAKRSSRSSTSRDCRLLPVGSDHPATRGAVIAFVTERSCRRRAWLPLLGELSSATSGSLTVALRAAASELRGTGLMVPAGTEREQAPTASSGTAACPGVATLLLNARSCRSGWLLASTSGAPGGCSGVALAMRPMLVARTDSLRQQGQRVALRLWRLLIVDVSTEA